MEQTMSGQASPVALTSFLVALRAKGESVAEMRGLSETMLAHAQPYGPIADGTASEPGGRQALDVVGTGGDGAHTVNISTMAAIVAAGAGVPVIKHGNRAASSTTGAADVLEALGVRLDLTPSQVAQVGEQCGITFCFAPTFHPSMRHAGPTRRELGVPTAFNFLGPLTNPAQPTYSAVGVGSAVMAPVLAGVFADRGQQAVIFRGGDGLDEVTPATTTGVWWVAEGVVTSMVLDPRRVGFNFSPAERLRGQDAAFNADVVRSVCDGHPGPIGDAVSLNAGLALALVECGDEGGTPRDEEELHAAWATGIAKARASIEGGHAGRVLVEWIDTSARV